uniref:Uncharacterized protein n=1 Tax=Arion vulgaris TaxID=1028688 RepID=A0A0B6ZFU7_9EUPU
MARESGGSDLFVDRSTSSKVYKMLQYKTPLFGNPFRKIVKCETVTPQEELVLLRIIVLLRCN